MLFISSCDWNPLFAKGVVHKWRHSILDNFGPPPGPSPNPHAFDYKGPYTVVTKSLTPSPPKTVTSYIDDPKGDSDCFFCSFIFLPEWKLKLRPGIDQVKVVWQPSEKMRKAMLLWVNIFSSLTTEKSEIYFRSFKVLQIWLENNKSRIQFQSLKHFLISDSWSNSVFHVLYRIHKQTPIWYSAHNYKEKENTSDCKLNNFNYNWLSSVNQTLLPSRNSWILVSKPNWHSCS